MKIQALLYLFVVVLFAQASAQEYNERHGWPEQKQPKNVIVCETGKNIQQSMLLESLSGLAAQSVNEGVFDELVWIKVKNVSYQKIYEQTIAALGNPHVKIMDIWSLVGNLQKKGVIKGYVLYQQDQPRRNAYASYPNINYSSNVATVYASLLKGILKDENLVHLAARYGLKKLKDARYESPKECFEKNKSKLNNSSALSVPPLVSNLRDYAISQKLMLYADQKELIDKVLEWVKPLSPILGWGCGDEYDFTSVITRWGHYNTATNWCWNLPLISSMSSKVDLKKVKEISLEEINFKDTSSFHSFIMSDGDNMQWTMASFLDNSNYCKSQLN